MDCGPGRGERETAEPKRPDGDRGTHSARKAERPRRLDSVRVPSRSGHPGAHKDCTVSEARRVLEDNTWELNLAELKAFIALLYVRGAIGGRTLELSNFWSAEWGTPYFKETMSRNRFQSIMRFLRFD